MYKSKVFVSVNTMNECFAQRCYGLILSVQISISTDDAFLLNFLFIEKSSPLFSTTYRTVTPLCRTEPNSEFCVPLQTFKKKNIYIYIYIYIYIFFLHLPCVFADEYIKKT